MAATSVVGLQWGDEAKGKIVDLLTAEHDVVVRYQGGNNAGHTVRFAGETYKLSLLPAGILSEDVTCVIATGVVVDPAALLQELQDVQSRRGTIEPRRLRISDRAHVIFPYHIAEEDVLERRHSRDGIGTTRRGIGTCYRDKAGRTHAFRLGDLLRPDSFRRRLREVVAFKNTVLRALDPQFEPFDAEAIFEDYRRYAEQLEPFITDTTAFLHECVRNGRRLLFEGAQGSLLDVDHGTYPYVTSSNSSGCGIHSGSGVSERIIDRMIGVVKAYTTRVGGGPFPTELDDEIGQTIRDRGHEYGTVTGRPRRCGWFDAVAARYGAEVSGVDELAIMLLDVLSTLEEVRICEAYELDGRRTTTFPSHVEDLERVRPVYRTLPGWKEEITAVRDFADLPAAAQRYVHEVEDILGYPVRIVSVGPDREQTIFR
ncbi:MAG: adenylosuccinate synthase [Planctomycetota bacterium]|nr:MAG: adenylosuccinate synthase [Planctomycetota bacterium]